MKKSKKTQNLQNKKFICTPCSFGCNSKNDFNRHLNTYKHKRLTNTSFILTKKLTVKMNVLIVVKFLSIDSLFIIIKKSVKPMSVS